jgi:hypothetical protein
MNVELVAEDRYSLTGEYGAEGWCLCVKPLQDAKKG